jgi:uncharacterized iron-regulated protein
MRHESGTSEDSPGTAWPPPSSTGGRTRAAVASFPGEGIPEMRRLRLAGVLALGLLAAGCASSPASSPSWAGLDPAATAPAGAVGAVPDPPGWADLAPTQVPPGVRVFTADGAPSTWETLVAAAGASRVILLGEYHDDVRSHRARHALVRRLAWEGETPPEQCAPLVLSLEMLERDVQLVVDEYQAGLITAEHFRRAARPWDNHERDYEPYLEIARACDLPVVAANPPRRYVNRVARLGEGALEALAPEARDFLPPLPVAPPSEAYRAEWRALMGGAAHGGAPHGGDPHGTPPHGGAADGPAAPRDDPVLLAQNLWDAGMAWAVAQAAEAHPAARVIHVAGAFHVAGGTGIPEHLDRYLSGVAPLVVVAYPVEAGAPFDPERHAGAGDFVILSDR